MAKNLPARPKLNHPRHVEQLRALQGTWTFARLEIDGNVLPAAALTASRLLIDGDRFRTESPEGTYEGVFSINVEADPKKLKCDMPVEVVFQKMTDEVTLPLFQPAGK